MRTLQAHDAASIALDARRVLDASRAALHDPPFKARVTKHELDVFQANIEKVDAGDGARGTTLHAQVAAGAHTAVARAALITVFGDVRDDAKLAFPKDKPMQHAFGVGAHYSAASTSEVRHVAESLVAAAGQHKAEAKEIGLDTAAVHHLEDLMDALDGADIAHVHTVTNRHTNSTATDSQVHVVSAETAHLRLVAHRVYRNDEAKLAPFASTLPRRAVTPRTPTAPTPPAGSTPQTGTPPAGTPPSGSTPPGTTT
jgi:hypothetical protein